MREEIIQNLADTIRHTYDVDVDIESLKSFMVSYDKLRSDLLIKSLVGGHVKLNNAKLNALMSALFASNIMACPDVDMEIISELDLADVHMGDVNNIAPGEWRGNVLAPAMSYDVDSEDLLDAHRRNATVCLTGVPQMIDFHAVHNKLLMADPEDKDKCVGVVKGKHYDQRRWPEPKGRGRKK